MNIPTVESIRKSVRNKNQNMKLVDILKVRENRRKKWPIQKQEEYNEYLLNLKQAHNSYVQNLQDEIINKSKFVIQRNIEADAFTLVQPQMIDSELGQFLPNMIFNGVWNHKNKIYDRIQHIEAGIDDTPLVEINDRMAKYGYKITDISETKKGAKTVIKIEFDI